MRSSLVLWILALVLTVSSAAWQRRTGPTHPTSGRATVAGRTVTWTFERTHKGGGEQPVRVRAPQGVTGTLEWRRLDAGTIWTAVPMERRGDALEAALPAEPPAVVLLYRVAVTAAGATAMVPDHPPVVIRYTGPVPPYILVPHILLMITAMLLSTRAGLECFARVPRLRAYTRWALGALFVGGMVLGPLVLHHAFGFWWSGWPLGGDITDDKTLIALVGWIVAAVAVHASAKPRPWVLAAAVLMFLVFMIPHSYRGTGLEESAPTAPGAPAER